MATGDAQVGGGVTVEQFLQEKGWSPDELAARIGRKVQTVERRMRGEKGDTTMPESWLQALSLAEQAHGDGLETNGTGGRASETPPSRPEGAQVRPDADPVFPGSTLDFASVKEAVTSIYATAGELVAPSDAALGGALIQYAEPAGAAWARWAAANPRLAAWLEKMMVGTPAGEVIGVHVGIAFAYFMARSAESQRIRAAAAADDDEHAFEPDAFA